MCSLAGMPIAGLGTMAQTLCGTLLLRAIDLIEQSEQALATELFGVVPLASELCASGQPVHCSPSLTFTHNEPAVNLYSAGPGFEPHKDLQALTVLVPLVGAEAFQGGGTGFWSRPPAKTPSSHAMGTVRHVIDTAAPATVITPPAGTALLFGGDVTHAGQPVIAGQRAVFVASFSRQSTARQAVGGMDMPEEELQRLERTVLEQMYGDG